MKLFKLKHSKQVHMFLLFFFLLLSVIYGSVSSVNAKKAEEVRSVWVSCFDYETAGLNNQSEVNFRKNVAKLFSTLKNNGSNTVYFHVVSFNDAIYPSNIYKWNAAMTSNGIPSYDPLKIIIEEAKKKEIQFHAWINPYRITSKKIYDPGKPTSTKRIVKGVKEIIENYNVDGIHFDDYFYPASSHPQYKKYKKVPTYIRKQNVNRMIRSVYKTVKEVDNDISFGISPAGDISYCNKIGVDLKTWLSKSGYIDYIIPQIYWTNRYKKNRKTTKLFNIRLKKWNALNQNDIPMYIGLALYRSGVKHPQDLGWSKYSSNIASQVKLLRKAGNEGYSLFSYQSLTSKVSKKEMKNYKKKILFHLKN